MTEKDIIKATVTKSLELFTRYFFKERNSKKFIVAEHHKIIFDALERVMSGECKRLIINIAPRYGKTEIAVKNFIAYSLALNPKAKFIHLSYSDQLALDNSEDIKDLLESTEFKEIFPEVEIKKDSRAKNKWYTTEGGGVLARASGGQVTGFGAGETDFEDFNNLFGGAIVIDDPIKPDDAFSDTIRGRINQRFDSTIRNRVNSRNTPIIIIMQRLHEEDLSGYLIANEPDKWEVIELPVIKEDGTALWEAKHTLEELEELRKANEMVFDTQYLQKPIKISDNALFKKDKLQYFNPNEISTPFETSFAFGDIADEGTDSTCIVYGRNIGSKIYITDVVFSKLLDDVTIPLAIEKAKEQKTTLILCESNNMGAMYARNLRTQIHYGCDVDWKPTKTNKHTRIITEANTILKYCIFVEPQHQSEMYSKFMNELTQYNLDPKLNKNIHDDAPDGLTGLVQFIKYYLQHLYY